MDVLKRWWETLAGRTVSTDAHLRRWAVANLIANAVLIVTGAVVRLTSSGLGCPTWPRCDANGYVPRAALGHHGVIEFGNRTLTFVLMAVAAGTVITAYRSHAGAAEKRLSWYALAGIPLQGVVGGITVLTKLNPWVVALHLLLSIWLIVVCTRLVMRTRAMIAEVVPTGLRRLVHLQFWVMLLAVWLGTVVTGAGPHSGDSGARRNNLDILTVARLHALAVWVAVGLTLIVLVQARRRGLAATARAAMWLVGAELVQAAIGYAQYFSGIPIWLVICHMLGIGLVVVAATWLWSGCRAADRPASVGTPAE